MTDPKKPEPVTIPLNQFFTPRQILALSCGNLPNEELYSVIGEDCYYKNERIGTMTVNNETGDAFICPVRSLEYITVNIEI